MIAYVPSQGGVQMTGADVWRVIRSNLWLVILMLILSSAAGYGVNVWLTKYHSHYTATGLLEVVPPVSYDNLVRGSVDPQTLLVDLKTHAQLIRHPSFLNKVLDDSNSEIRQTVWFNHFLNPLEAKADLANNLEVLIQPDSRLLQVSMTYSDPSSCKVIVEQVVDKYIQQERDTNSSLEEERHRDLENRLTGEEIKLKEVSGEIEEKQGKLNSLDEIGVMSKIDAKGMELQALLNEKIKNELEVSKAEDRYKSVTDKIALDQDTVDVSNLINTDYEVANMRNMLIGVDIALEEAKYSTGAESPTMINLVRREQMLQQRVATSMSNARVKYRLQVQEASHENLNDAKRNLAATDKGIDSIKSQMADLQGLMTEMLRLQDERSTYQAKVKNINDQLDMIANMGTKKAFAGVEWRGYPEKPDVPSFPKLPATMSLSVLIGLAMALGIAFLRELLDTSIRSPRDISRVGNMNLLGMVPHEDDDPQSAGARLPVVIFEAPHSMMAEQLRQVRTRLQHSSSLDTTRSILITSPSPGDGKSTIACNLASGLALNGRRILLVDANFRRPELHRIFNLSNEQGFSDVLNSLDLFESSVQETQVPNLYILPSGPKPTNATELLESQLLMDFIERALEEFDHVIFDSGPMLFVSETVALAPRVDGVVTVVRARTNSRGVLSRMRDGLRQVKAEHLGVVLNAVRAQGGGYYGRNIRTYYEYQNGNGRAA
jgi:capsular exopolysaccharide synthesis family protein